MISEKPYGFNLCTISLLIQMFIIFVLFSVGETLAQDEDYEVSIANSFDFQLLGGMVGRLEAHGSELMGDMIDKKTGGITLEQTDIAIPGNSGLEVALRRKMTQGSSFYSPYQQAFGDWALDIPVAYIGFGYGGPSSLPVIQGGCMQSFGDIGNSNSIDTSVAGITIPVFGYDHTDGMVLHVPGKSLSGFQGVARSNTVGISDPLANWKSGGRTTDQDGRCAEVVIAPDGTKYKFGRHAFRTAKDFTQTVNVNGGSGTTVVVAAGIPRKYLVFLITEVVDLHGNWVRYTYTNDSRAELQSIRSNDGRSITLAYEPTILPGAFNSRRVTQISAHGRVWMYGYTGTLLRTVTLPDGRLWDFIDMTGMRYEVFNHWNCVPIDRTFSMKHPDGAVGTFILRETRHIKSAKDLGSQADDSDHYMREQVLPAPNVTNNSLCLAGSSNLSDQPPLGLPVYRTMSLVQKKISAPNVPDAIWSFEYRGYTGGALAETWSKITDPDGTKRTYTYQAVGHNHGTLKRIDTVPLIGSGEVISYEYETSQPAPATCGAGGRHGDSMGACLLYAKRPVRQITHVRDGVTYTTIKAFNKTGASFTDFGLPNKIARYSSLSPANQRITDISYWHNPSNNIIGLTKSVVNNNKEFVSYNYNTKGQSTSVNKFGSLWNSFVYHNDGNLFKVTDSLNYSAYFEDYYRGNARKITRRDGAILYRAINEHGWVTSETNARGYTTNYQYNLAGWMTLVDLPNPWVDISVNYENIGTANFYSVERRGTKEKVTWYDAMMRPRLERQGATVSLNDATYTKTKYDSMGRVSFTSFPSLSSDPANGTSISYDGLGRLIETRENVSPFATTTTQYLVGNKVRVRDPLNQETTRTLSGFSSPNDGNVTRIEQPLGVTTDISYDIFGNMLSATRSGNTDGANRTNTQRWSYDSRLNLCRHYAPETGSKIFLYDARDLVSEYGEGLIGTSGCITSITSSERVALTYDSEGRNTLIDFPSGTPDITKVYDPNGNLLSVSRDGVIWTYTYDSKDNISTEKLALDGRNFNLAYTYNSAGELIQSTLPSGRVLSYNNDGRGRPQSVAATGYPTVATGITYNVNNSIKTLAYGNGKQFAQPLNPRLLPESISVTPSILNFSYSYNARGQITSIIDTLVSGNSKSMQYDGLGRLTVANGPWGAGSYSYDALGNIRRKSLGTRVVNVNYDASLNRVLSNTDTAGSTRSFSHDARGNVIGLGSLYFSYDRSNQPILLSGSATGTYKYDGNLKRIKSTVGGKEIYYIYNAAGNLVHVHAVTDNKVTDYVRIVDKTIARITNNTITYLHNDHLGSPLAATTASGTVAWSEQYTPYGEKMIDNSANYDLGSFTGHIDDSATGLTYMQARYYDPVIGRFLSNDPLGFSPVRLEYFNRYAYVENDPVNKNDPTGMFASSFSSQAFDRHSGWMPRQSVPTASSPIPSSGTREISVSVTASWGTSATGAAGIAIDSKANVAVTLTAGIGGGTPGASLEVGATTTNAESVNDLQGASGLTTVGGGEGLVGSASAISGAGYTGTTVSAGIGVGTPVSASGHVTVTQVINLTGSSPPPVPDDKLKQ